MEVSENETPSSAHEPVSLPPRAVAPCTLLSAMGTPANLAVGPSRRDPERERPSRRSGKGRSPKGAQEDDTPAAAHLPPASIPADNPPESEPDEGPEGGIILASHEAEWLTEHSFQAREQAYVTAKAGSLDQSEEVNEVGSEVQSFGGCWYLISSTCSPSRRSTAQRVGWPGS